MYRSIPFQREVGGTVVIDLTGARNPIFIGETTCPLSTYCRHHVPSLYCYMVVKLSYIIVKRRDIC